MTQTVKIAKSCLNPNFKCEMDDNLEFKLTKFQICKMKIQFSENITDFDEC